MQALEDICAQNPKSKGIILDTGNARYLNFYKSIGYQVLGVVKLGTIVESILFKPRS
jgi:hypothetical protein